MRLFLRNVDVNGLELVLQLVEKADGNQSTTEEDGSIEMSDYGQLKGVTIQMEQRGVVENEKFVINAELA